MLRQMFYKLFVKGGGLFLLALVIVTAAASVLGGISKAKLKNEDDLKTYRELISEYRGNYTEEKEAAFERLAEEKQTVFDKIDALNARYAKENISFEAYQTERLALNELLAGSDGYMMFCNRVSAAKNGDIPIFDDTVWNVLFSQGISELIVVASVITAAVILALRDLELPVKLLFSTTLGGARKTFLLNAAFIFVLSLLLGFVSAAVKLTAAHFGYGLEYGGVPLNALSLFAGSDRLISLIGGFWIFSILQAFGFAFFGGFVLLAGVLLRNTLYTAALGFLSVIVPSVFTASKPLLLIPAPFNMIYAVKLFSGVYDAVGEKYFLSAGDVLWALSASMVLCIVFYAAYILIGTRRKKV